MELREFAERILFADTLEGKLLDPGPGPITDDHPGSALTAPAQPGRPERLRFKNSGPDHRSGGFPGPRPPASEAEAGRLLHFFANHELLATELMALALLRFPEAPTAFRRGVLQTLRDEQEHTRGYVTRMRACGIDFGDLPVSGYFWRAVSGMESPIDYVSGLSLTFEQANLDFARHYASCFQAAGDSASAALLERIYRDEIAHVAYGLKWFRRWKDPSQSDWDAFCRHLRFPLSPQRAKGFRVNVEGRRAAGLEPDFIAELEVYAQSKGRTPVVHWFNPFAEAHLDRGPAFSPNLHQAALALDLEVLPQFLARPDDVVVVRRKPGVAHLARLHQAGFPLPEFLEAPDSAALATALGERKLGGLRPWAWAPDSLERLGPFLPNVTGVRPSPWIHAPPTLARLHGKPWSARFLQNLLQGPSPWGAWAAEPWLCPEEIVGLEATTPAEVAEILTRIRSGGHHRVVVKQALGLAGAGALRLWEPEPTTTQWRWIEHALDAGRSVVVEPWLDRLLEFSLQLEHGPGGLRLQGFTGLTTDLRGQYLANHAAPDHARRLPPGLLPLLTAEPPHPPGSATPVPPLPIRIQALFEELRSRLQTELRALGHQGPVGIDAFVYRDQHGRPRLKPVVEINPRYTMGRILLELMTRAAPGSHGRLDLINPAGLRRLGVSTFTRLAEALQSHHPVRLEGDPVPRIRSGFIPLNDPATASVCLAVLRVSTDPVPDLAPTAG